MNQFLARHSKAAVAAGLSVAVLSGGAAAYAVGGPSAAAGTQASAQAGTTPAPDNNAAANGNAATNGNANKPNRLKALSHAVFGAVVSTSTTGGAVKNAGTITLAVPNNPSDVVNLAPATRVFAYNGPGQAPTKEAIGDVKAGDHVAVYVVTRGARAAGGSNTGSSSTGVPVAALILDLGTF